jgi:hypothetical protein
MRDQAPRMFQELRRHGRLEQHLKQKNQEAYELLRQILKGNENPTLAEKREAEEVVRSILIDFPPEYLKEPREHLEPPDDLNFPGSGVGRPAGQYAALMADLFQQQRVGSNVPDEPDGHDDEDAGPKRAAGATGIERAIWRFAWERYQRLAARDCC